MRSDGPFEDPARGASRHSKLGHHCRSDREGSTEERRKTPDESCEEISETRRKGKEVPIPNASKLICIASILESSSYSRLDTGVQASTTVTGDCDRCFPLRMGVPHFDKSARSRNVGQSASPTAHKCARISGGAEGPTKTRSSSWERCAHNAEMRQLNSSTVYKQEWVSSVGVNQHHDSQSEAAITKKGLDPRSASHQGTLNVLADALSRQVPISTEWALDTRSFEWACARLSIRPQVDLCATVLNCKLPTFVAPCQMSRATAVDCLQVDWNQWEAIYLFLLSLWFLRF